MHIYDYYAKPNQYKIPDWFLDRRICKMEITAKSWPMVDSKLHEVLEQLKDLLAHSALCPSRALVLFVYLTQALPL